MRMSRFLYLATAVGGLLGLALSVLASVALRLAGLAGDVPVIVAGLVAGFGIGLLGGVWVEQEEEQVRRDRARRAKGLPPGVDPDRQGRPSPLFGPLAFGLTFVTIGSFAGLRAAQELSTSNWAPLAGIAWLTFAIAGGAGGVIAGAVWQVVIARLMEAGA
jgi:hypothetical protein